MPVLYGSVTNDPRVQLTPPPPEHPGERNLQLKLPGIEMGVWVPSSVKTEDASFYDKSGETFLACICDAELTNKSELRQILASRGFVLKSDSNAELVARLFSTFGPDIFSQLDGSFRCAIWMDGHLHLAVDRFGIKRMNYCQSESDFHFGSRINWLGRFRPEISLRAVSQYIQMAFIPTAGTIFENVHRLSPGCQLVWNGKSAHTSQYWTMSYPENLTGSTDALGAQLESQLGFAVKKSVSDLSIEQTGCYLSGGTDSSTVLGMAARAWGRAPESYTIGFAEEAFSELYYSRLAAKHFGAKTNETIVREADGWRILPALVRAFDQPFANSSSVGSYFCAEMAAKNSVEVMLAGDAGDELFGGNERYAKDKVYGAMALLPSLAYKNAVWNSVWALTSGNANAVRLKNIFHRATLENPERFYMEDTSTPGLNGDFLAPALSAAMGTEKPLEIMRRYYAEASAKSELNRLLYIDLKLTITDNDLVKVSDTAAACGVRVRYPFLERELVDFSGGIPARLKLKGLQKRFLFKHALRNFLPKEILTKSKHGFGVPVSVWFRKDKNFRELIHDVTSDRQTKQRGYVNPATLKTLVDEHQSGLRDWGQLLWALLMLELWHREVASGA
jgi:asparagine synthase (glutamine-hydrolysing)